MDMTGGSATVILDDAPTSRQRSAFLDAQLVEARRKAGACAAALALACSNAAPPGALDAAARATCEATAELRMALQARRLSPL